MDVLVNEIEDPEKAAELLFLVYAQGPTHIFLGPFDWFR